MYNILISIFREFNDAKTKTSSNDARIINANKLLAKLKKDDGLCDHINKLQNLSSALIDLAYYQFPDERKKEYTIPKTQKIRKIQDLEDILLPTVDLAVRIDKDYSKIVGKYIYKILNVHITHQSDCFKFLLESVWNFTIAILLIFQA